MGANSAIEWTKHTHNWWEGCEKVSDGCTNCYAETRAVRFGHSRGGKHLPLWGPDSVRKLRSDAYWREPLKWNREAEAACKGASVFCMSLGDVFEVLQAEPMASDMAAARQRGAELIRQTKWLRWLLLTKRPENAPALLAGMFPEGMPNNVMVGVTVENQRAADERLPVVMGELRSMLRLGVFLSLEPLLGPVDLSRWLGQTGIVWGISGGESGRRARPSHPDWHRSLRHQFTSAGVPFLFKQHGEWLAVTGGTPEERLALEAGYQWDGIPTHVWADNAVSYRVGKKAAGRMLDGRTWDEVPW